MRCHSICIMRLFDDYYCNEKMIKKNTEEQYINTMFSLLQWAKVHGETRERKENSGDIDREKLMDWIVQGGWLQALPRSHAFGCPTSPHS